MRLVLDTSILVAAIRSPGGASQALLLLALDEGFTMLASVPLALECEAVLTRPEHLQASGLGVEEVDMLLDALLAVAEPVRLLFLWRPALRDPNDDMLLEAAVKGQADAIATFNKRDFSAAHQRFGVEVLSPGEALRRVRKK